MIHKYLVIHKRIFLSSTKLEDTLPRVEYVELFLPVQIYWDINKMLKEVDYLLAGEEPQVDVQSIYKKVYRMAAPYAKGDVDRNWLMAKLGVK